MDRKKIISILLVVFIYIISAGVSYALFPKSNKKNIAISPLGQALKSGSSQLAFDDSLPKTEECPLNGVLYSKKQKEWWQTHRPLGIMIENHKESRPQSGISYADVIYEAVAEGGITRFLAVYYCKDAGEIGPVRSARAYFIDFLSEYGNYPLYAHVGGANQPGPADALGQLTDYGWTGHNDLNQFSIGFPVFWRDYNKLRHEVATEHTMYSTTEKLWKYAAASRKLTNIDEEGALWDKGFIPYAFADDASLSSRPQTQTIHLEFWTRNPDYFVDWTYEQTSNLYKRANGDVAHTDINTKQLTARNIVVLFMKEINANDGYIDNNHLLYKNKGTGEALIFKDGIQTKGIWRKDSRTSKTLIFDKAGNPLKFNRGVIWFEILPTDGVVNVK